MTITDLEEVESIFWHEMIQEYIESNDRVKGISMYYELLEWYINNPRFLPGEKDEYVIIDIFDALTGQCAQPCHIGTGDYHIIE